MKSTWLRAMICHKNAFRVLSKLGEVYAKIWNQPKIRIKYHSNWSESIKFRFTPSFCTCSLSLLSEFDILISVYYFDWIISDQKFRRIEMKELRKPFWLIFLSNSKASVEHYIIMFDRIFLKDFKYLFCYNQGLIYLILQQFFPDWVWKYVSYVPTRGSSYPSGMPLSHFILYRSVIHNFRKLR